MSVKLPFNRPCTIGPDAAYVREAIASGHLCGDGPFGKRAQALLEKRFGALHALLTTSCTAALEMAALLCDLSPGDEVILPSYTFVSTANAIALRGARTVFVDIRPDTLNLDEQQLAAAITPRTRAIVPVHYAGVGCEMDVIRTVAERHGVALIEDNAHGLLGRYRGQLLGTFGALGCYSFHETKNIACGEGGALLINDPALVERAEIIREKGTNRSQFFRGQVDKYTWVDIGSSYLPGELIAAFLWAQMEEADSITRRRLGIWNTYHQWFAEAERQGRLRRPVIPAHCAHNAHMYYLLLPGLEQRTAFIERLRGLGIHCVFHYIPLHDAPAGRRFGRAHGELSVTEDIADRLVRLPLWLGMEDAQAEIIQQVLAAL